MNLKGKAFVWFYCILVLFDLACGFESLSSVRLISKPLLLISLLVYFIFNAGSSRNLTFYLMIGALFCSLLGDIFLLFESASSLYFTLGLASFLIAHLLYTFVFILKRKKKPNADFKWVVLIFSAYGILLFFFLKDNLGALKVPVILYILGILTMVVTAYIRKENVTQSSFNLVFIGALFFVVSDSILAIDKFSVGIPFAHILIMGTYATAQYLIMKGVLYQVNNED